jgi:hypothetical protein
VFDHKAPSHQGSSESTGKGSGRKHPASRVRSSPAATASVHGKKTDRRANRKSNADVSTAPDNPPSGSVSAHDRSASISGNNSSTKNGQQEGTGRSDRTRR